jgi:hypothetical protein
LDKNSDEPVAESLSENKKPSIYVPIYQRPVANGSSSSKFFAEVMRHGKEKQREKGKAGIHPDRHNTEHFPETWNSGRNLLMPGFLPDLSAHHFLRFCLG